MKLATATAGNRAIVVHSGMDGHNDLSLGCLFFFVILKFVGSNKASLIGEERPWAIAI